MERQWTVACIDFAAIPHNEHACINSGKENSLLTGRNLQQNLNKAHCEVPSAMTEWGFERTEQRQKKEHRSTYLGVLSMGKRNINCCSFFSGSKHRVRPGVASRTRKNRERTYN
ncbi:hypothetical protein ILYODFUR_026842 [Ilyodon furcidens]|uniref:Uncharacterized protein n=1 Tax=Ilyodon furcidens TaxID=33524 RepID=A0ABV0V739_9TELE